MLKVATNWCSSHAAFGAHLRRGEPPSPLLRLILGRNNRTPYIIRRFFCSDSTESSDPDNASAARVKSSDDSKSSAIVPNLVSPEDCLTVIALPLSHRPLFTGFYMPVYVKDPKLLSALVESRKRQAPYTGAFLVKDEEEAEGSDSDKNIYDLKGKELFDRLREVGTLAQITSIQGDQVVLICHRRLRITEMVSEDPLTVKVDHLKEIPYDKDDDILEATSFEVISTLRDVLKTSPLWRDHAQTYIQHVGDFTYPRVADFVAAISGANKQQCQQVLEELDVHKRLKLTLELLKKEMEISKIQESIAKAIGEKISGEQRRYLLNEQLKAIKKELGLETDDKTALSAKFRERLDPKKEKIPAHVLQVIEELPKLQLLEASSSEFNVTRNYLDWLTALPWGEYSDENFDVIRAQEILDEDHYGLTDVKERILEFIAVGKLRGISQGKIICRSGLPGVGKTSIDRSIARALSRKFYRFSVGGLSDVAEIKGHRRTYIGAMHLEVIKDADVVDVKSTWDKPLEVIKEPDVCSASRNLLFSFPGCISVDGSGDQLFLSDVNHHRIIVLNSKGEILDAIGSSPGFEDGEFETAKLMRPASSFYDSSEDCLYFVDSENHAIRRADMGTRVVDTVFPASNGSQKGLWGRILDKIWTQRNTKLKSEEHDSSILLFPWHLLKSSKNDIFVLNQSFGTLWIVDLNLGLIREVIEESSKILEICGHVILEKCDPLRQIPDVWIKQQVDTYCSLEGIPYGGLMSSAASCQDDVIFCDEVGQRLVKFNKGSGSATTLCLSNFGILGLPYWLTLPIETMYSVDGPAEINIDHSECFRLLPGRVDIELTVDVPQHTDLVEVPQEGCIWCQARGAAVEISGIEKQNAGEKVNRTQKFFDRIEGWILRQTRGAAAEISGVEKRSAAEKVSATQKFYDDFDNLFYISEDESSAEAENQALGEGLPEGRVRIGCTIYTSPGTSEVIVYAALYLRLKKDSNAEGDKDAVKAAMIADILEPKRKSKRDLLVKQLSERQGVEEVVFTRPLHVRLKFNCDNHPKGDDPVQTHSSVKAHVTL